MATRMLTFTTTARTMPAKRAPAERRADFQEIYREFAAAKAAEQAARCSQCGVPFCQVHCPLGNNIPDWLMLTAEGRLREAHEAAAATNIFPEICGRICPQDRLCEGSCVLEQSGHGTVTIGAVEKFITETAWDEGWVAPLETGPERGQSAGIIGAGPAGLAAAAVLRRKGYGVTVYDRYDRAGGLLMYGIPSFKLEKEVVARRTEWLRAGGVRFALGIRIGRDLPFDEVRRRHEAVLIATGVYRPRRLEVPGVELPGVHQALDYLTAANRAGLGDALPASPSGALDARGRNVVVLGGGDTAMDCVRTAVRQGARSVTCLYRRDRANMPGSARETAHAEEEGVVFKWLSLPKAILSEERVTHVLAAQGRLGDPDPSGRRTVEAALGQDFTVEADMVVNALGFTPEDLPTLFSCPDLPVTDTGTIEADPDTQMTALPGVFAAGDIVRGASLVVWAIRDGREAAATMDRYMTELARPLLP